MKLFFEAHLFLDIKTTFKLQKPQCKIFDGFKMKVESPLSSGVLIGCTLWF